MSFIQHTPGQNPGPLLAYSGVQKGNKATKLRELKQTGKIWLMVKMHGSKHSSIPGIPFAEMETRQLRLLQTASEIKPACDKGTFIPNPALILSLTGKFFTVDRRWNVL